MVLNDQIRGFYERHPYPPPLDELEGSGWDDKKRRVESHLLWPSQPFRDDRTILVAGCGTSQAAKYALRWPNAQVTGIDVSATSIAFTNKLKSKYSLDNLQVRQLDVTAAAELGQSFEHVVCTGVLHHLPDPDAGLRALHDVLSPTGALNMMVYAPYGRAGIYQIQDYCRRLGVGTTTAEIQDLVACLKALAPDHPLMPLLRSSPDFQTEAGLADALLHPQDRSYSVPQLFDFLDRGDLTFGRWIRQAPYSPECGSVGQMPHRPRLMQLPVREQYAALELFRGTMVRHGVVAYRKQDNAQPVRIDFECGDWPDYVPLRVPEAIAVHERLPSGASAVLINRAHTFTDLYLPITAEQEQLLNGIDGTRSIAAIIGPGGNRKAGRDFFRQLWLYDQVAFDTSQVRKAS